MHRAASKGNSSVRELLPLSEAAQRLQLSVPQLRHAIAKGAPTAHRGTRGRGHATLIDVDVMREWMRADDGQRAALERPHVRRAALTDAGAMVDRVLAEMLHHNELAAVEVRAWLAQRVVGYVRTRLQLALREEAERNGGLPLPKIDVKPSILG
jgi:hypothetical protein